MSGPAWAPNRWELFLRSDFKIMAVDVSTGPKPRVGNQHELFEARCFREGNRYGPMYDVSPDGRRFVLWPIPAVAAKFREHGVVLNWFQELGRLAPVRQ